jgi:hypothetical protein
MNTYVSICLFTNGMHIWACTQIKISTYLYLFRVWGPNEKDSKLTLDCATFNQNEGMEVLYVYAMIWN